MVFLKQAQRHLPHIQMHQTLFGLPLKDPAAQQAIILATLMTLE